MSVRPPVPPEAPSLDDLYRGIRPKLDKAEAVLRGWADSQNPLINEISRYILQERGKMLRPALVLLGARLLGATDEEDVFLAALVEVLHTAGIIHDDIVDDARERRGRESIHARWGPNVTVLIGDYLYIKSIGLSLRSKHDRVIRVVADLSAKMIEGELAEVAASGDLALSEPAYLDILEKKTASLFEACCRFSAILADAADDAEAALAQYGRELGMCFQLVDDLLDFTGDPRVLGKPVLSDLREGRITLPLIRALARDGRELRPRLQGLVRRRVISARECRAIVEHLRACGALEETFAAAKGHAERAKSHLAAFPDTEFRRALNGLADFALYRSR
jgi:octaprenyl-diphosphate synthase